ncbi:MAG: malto-oligosyltrehalose trehalohydrolase [Candidatus Eisenbacteria bacterium]|nr:malto-oligosyltrehalose trehalohydrolase [Candidatus Eisenbacteria bacterium]
MTPLRVWAPRAKRVEMETGGRRTVLQPAGGGWWVAGAPALRPGADYVLYLDGDGPFPDPRSPWQPQGVHGAARWVDHDAYRWSDEGWQPPPLETGVIYELHTGTFTAEGTFAAATERLDDLVQLGVTHVELMPVAEFSGDRGWGYDGVDLYAAHHAYGGPEGLKQLVDACHQRGLAVLLDVVYNHLGPSGNYLERFGPYFTDRYQTPWGKAVNLDGPDSDEVRRFFIDNALMWLRDYHLDGLRIDAVHAIFDISAIHFLEQLAGEAKRLEASLGRPLLVIAESDLNDPRVVHRREAGGYGLDAQWNEDFHHALHALLTGEREGYYRDFGRVADVAKVLTGGLVYDGRYSEFRRRTHGRPATGLSGHRFVGCLQNHDQIGNRAVGDRIGHLISREELMIGAALVLTSPFVPMLFQGEEWGASTPFLYFTNHAEPELAEAVRRGRREEFAAFGWDPESIPDPQAEETFQRSKLNWDERSRSPHAGLLEWHRRLIALRKGLPELTDGALENVQVRFDEEARWLVVSRGAVTVACNLADEEKPVPVPGPAGRRLLLASVPGVEAVEGRIALPGRAVCILGPERAAG